MVPRSVDSASRIPEGAEFDRRWTALSDEERKELGRYASSGHTHEEAHKAALVGGLAAIQLERLGRWWMWLIAPVFAGLAVMLGDLLGGSRSYVFAATLTVAGWGLLLWQRRQFRRALNATRDKLHA
jgi:hypothetical protein